MGVRKSKTPWKIWPLPLGSLYSSKIALLAGAVPETKQNSFPAGGFDTCDLSSLECSSSRCPLACCLIFFKSFLFKYFVLSAALPALKYLTQPSSAHSTPCPSFPDHQGKNKNYLKLVCLVFYFPLECNLCEDRIAILSSKGRIWYTSDISMCRHHNTRSQGQHTFNVIFGFQVVSLQRELKKTPNKKNPTNVSSVGRKKENVIISLWLWPSATFGGSVPNSGSQFPET